MIKLDDIYESREYKSLSDIFNNDDLGIFDNVKPLTNNKANNSILEQQFSSINSFIDNHGRLPAKDADTLSEKVLSRQLNSIKADSSVFKNILKWHIQNTEFPRHAETSAELTTKLRCLRWELVQTVAPQYFITEFAQSVASTEVGL